MFYNVKKINVLALTLGLFSSFFISQLACKNYDLTVLGFIRQGDGLGKVAFNLIHMLKNDLKINFISNNDAPNHFADVPDCVRKIVEDPNKTPGMVTVSTGFLWNSWNEAHKNIPNSKVKIAYSMIESDALPARSVAILNSKFDAVAVPDVFQKNVYANSGVKIPVFILPMGLFLEDFLNQPLKHASSTPFTFGMSGVWEPRKNHALLLEAFAREYGNNPLFKLKLHGRFGYPEVLQGLRDMVNRYHLKNVEILDGPMTQKEYVNFMCHLDCYVFLSKGEGFSMTPREAMAAGVPCILSNNTSHITLCKSGVVRPVKAGIVKPAYYSVTYQQAVGKEYDCSLLDVTGAMKDVADHYGKYLALAQKARNWVKQYQWYNLKRKYLSLIKPKKVIVGASNIVNDDGILQTRSAQLAKKYTQQSVKNRPKKAKKHQHGRKSGKHK